MSRKVRNWELRGMGLGGEREGTNRNLNALNSRPDFPVT